MALVINIVKSSINDAGTELNLSDSTGVYEVSDNPGGYGTPNPDRADIALILVANNKRQDDGDVECTVQTYNPVTATTFIVELNKDGWYQVDTYGLRLYDDTVLFDVTEAVYDVATSAIWKIATVSGVGPYTYTYTVITKQDLDSSAVIKAHESTLNTLVLVTLTECHTSAVRNYFNSASPVTNKTVVVDDANFNTYLKIDTYLKSINASFALENYTQGQLKVEQAEKLCSCIDDNCSC
jgi:hypothetical protein